MDRVHQYKIITFTHRNTHLNEIGEYVLPGFSEDVMMQRRLNQIKQQMEMQELMYLATCNRIMFFFTSEQDINSNAYQSKFFKTVYADIPLSLQEKGKRNCILLPRP
jgi:glutamyl-tRNA reductase